MRFQFVLALALLSTGCDRPLLGTEPPDLSVVAPDLSVVQTDRDITIRVSAQALRGVTRVQIGGLDAAYDEADDVWVADLFLSAGATRIPIAAFALDGEATRDTAYVVYAPVTVASPAVQILPEPRAGLTASRVPAVGVFLAGGETTGGVVLGTGRLLIETGSGFAVGDPITLQHARTGHTATVLDDGRVLLLGGTSAPSASAAGFVQAPEIFDPGTQTTRPVVTRGVPILRTHHVVTFLERGGREYLYITGGQTPGAGGVQTPATVEIAEFRPGPQADTLVTLTPDGGASNGVPFPDPTLVVVGTATNEATTVITGLSGSSGDARRIRYLAPGTLDYPYRIEPASVAPPAVPRTSAAGVLAPGGLGLLVGGVTPSGETLPTLEAYVDVARRWVTFPASVTLGTPRRDHAVTLAPSGRILALGGRGPSGQPLATLDVLSF